MSRNYFNCLLIILLKSILISYVSSSRILGIFPFCAKSHYIMFEPLMIELAKRGHEVVVISGFPQQKPITGLIDINGTGYLSTAVNALDINQHEKVPDNVFYILHELYTYIDDIKSLFDIPEVKKLITAENEHFDLIVTELFNNDVTLGFVNKFKAPFIALSSSALLPWANTRLANPDNPSYIPVSYSANSYKMNFWQRAYNLFASLTGKLAYRTLFVQKSEHLAKQYFGVIPPLLEIGKNTSLIFVNTHHSLHGARPSVPGVIEVGGMHIKQPNKLSQDLEKFINESEHGVIYFCMGSMLKASTLPEDKRLDLIEVFSKLPQRVLWKWETETMPGKPVNVKLVKWMPQRDVLAHPNIKLFISHGGLLGTTEAVYSGVPIIGMPFYGDQGVNIEAVQAAGAGIRLDFKDLNKETLYKAIREILDNPQYKENAAQLSERFRDRPQTPLETAVYWTEYVIRHKGAPHLRSAAVDLTWYQYLLLDVIAFLLVSFIAVLAILYYIIKYVYCFIKSLLFKPQKAKTKSKRKNE